MLCLDSGADVFEAAVARPADDLDDTCLCPDLDSLALEVLLLLLVEGMKVIEVLVEEEQPKHDLDGNQTKNGHGPFDDLEKAAEFPNVGRVLRNEFTWGISLSRNLLVPSKRRLATQLLAENGHISRRSEGYV